MSTRQRRLSGITDTRNDLPWIIGYLTGLTGLIWLAHMAGQICCTPPNFRYGTLWTADPIPRDGYRLTRRQFRGKINRHTWDSADAGYLSVGRREEAT